MIDKLEFLLALARERHFGRAAESCGVTQPTLSAAVKHLEDNLGILLVNRGSRFRDFTAEGERVLDWARRIIGDAQAMRQEIDALRHGLTGRLRIGVVQAALGAVEDLTSPYHERHPEVRLTILAATAEIIVQFLENLEIDAGITYLEPETTSRFAAIPLYRETYCLVTPADAPLGNRHKVKWAEVAQLQLCLPTPDTQSRRNIEALLRTGGGDPRSILESNSMLVLYAHVRTGRWATVLPSQLAGALGIPEPLRAIPIVEPEARHTIGLVVPLRQPLKPLTAALVVEAQRVAEKLQD